MSDKLNMALDDVIKQNKKGNKKGGAGGKKPQKNAPGKKTGGKKLSRPVKPVSGKAAENRRANKAGGKPGSGKGAGATTKAIRPTKRQQIVVKSKTLLKISNLDAKVQNNEIFELFAVFGALSKCNIDYDELGRSKHTAHIEYEEPESAKRAIEEYHGNTLDGKKIEVKYAEIKKDVPGIRKKAPFKKSEPEPSRKQPERRERNQTNGRRGGRAGGRNRRGGRGAGAANKKSDAKA